MCQNGNQILPDIMPSDANVIRKQFFLNKQPLFNLIFYCFRYDSGAAVYFYFGFNYIGLSDPVEAYEHIENCARDEILSCGGSLSHHHGVGKLRSRWYSQSVSTVGVGLYKAAKLELDPKNIFAAGNLLDDDDREKMLIQSKL